MSTSENDVRSRTSQEDEKEGDVKGSERQSSVGENPGLGSMAEKPPTSLSLEQQGKDEKSTDKEFSAAEGKAPEKDEKVSNTYEEHGAAAETVSEDVGQTAQKLNDLGLTSDNTEESRKARQREKSLPPPPLPVKDDVYLDPTPSTPMVSRSPTRAQSGEDTLNEKTSSDRAGHSESQSFNDEEKEKQPVDDGSNPSPQNTEESESELQSIMGQFQDSQTGLDKEGVMSPRLELAGQLLGGPIQYPPRRSSLEPLKAPIGTKEEASTSPWTSHASGQSAGQRMQRQFSSQSSTPRSPAQFPPSGAQGTADGSTSPPTIPHPPLPEPEPDQPFDFHRFLEQLRHRTADPVAKFLRSFLTEFGKKQWMVHEQVKIISDFLAFITNKMAQCDIWKGVSDSEFDNAREGMEKLVMNRLYTQTFSPAIPPPPPLPRSRSKRKEVERGAIPGRRGQHQEDVERDEVLAQKVRIYGWVREEHLDIPDIGPNGRRFLTLARQELLKIKGYRAPRDKVICVLNCCKVIFGLLKHAQSSDTSADSFIPLLILVVLHANPEHLVSNVQYILRFRNQDKLGGEAGYYLSSLMGAIQFIETLDRTSLTVSDEDFEKNVEAAVSAIAERPQGVQAAPSVGQPTISEKSSLSGPEVTPRNSLDAEYSTPRRREGPIGSSTDNVEENAAVQGLLRTIQRPLSTIGRIFSDDGTPQRPSYPASTPQPGSTPRLSPAVFQTPRGSGEGRRSADLPMDGTTQPCHDGNKMDAEEAAARQASAEAAEARKIQRAEHKDVVETLSGMFPNLDKDVIDDVVRMKEGRVGLAVDACLALSAES